MSYQGKGNLTFGRDVINDCFHKYVANIVLQLWHVDKNKEKIRSDREELETADTHRFFVTQPFRQ